MNNDEFELMLYDRIEMIKTTNAKYDLEHNAYLSFSGGKDSTILHYLLDLALPNNKIPRVYINTGIEYVDMVKFVKDLASKDERVIMVSPSKPIKKTLDTYGYPFKSKEHSLRVEYFNKIEPTTDFVKRYIEGYDESGRKLLYAHCPKILLYQFKERGKYHYSNKCCYELKKKPAHKWAIDNKRAITLTGMRKEERGNRQRLTCAILKEGKLQKFHPLIPVSEEFENMFIEKYNIQLCKLYYPPFNFKRTGCKGCPFALELQKELDVMERLLPTEARQCEIIWKPVYDEYRRLNYRLKGEKQTNLFDFIEDEEQI